MLTGSRLSGAGGERATRLLAITAGVSMFGTGLFLTVSVVYLTVVVGLTAAQVGLGLSIAGVVGLTANLPAGHLAERYGAKNPLIYVNIAQAVVTAGYIWVHSFAAFAALASGELFLANASSALRSGLIAAIAGEQRVRTRALLRAVTNTALAAGASCAGIALHLNSRPAYVTLIVVDAVSYLLVGWLARRLPDPPLGAAPGAVGGRRVHLVAVRDGRYLVMVAISSLMCIYGVLLQVVVPLWIVHRTDAPRWTISLLFLLNTGACALFQVRLSRYAEGLPAASRAIAVSGLLLLAACALIGYSAGVSGAVCVLMLTAAGALHVGGEMLQQAGNWTLAFELAPADFQGQYQGLFSMTTGIGNALGPVVIVPLVFGLGRPGWLLVGVIFAVSGVALARTGRVGTKAIEGASSATA